MFFFFFFFFFFFLGGGGGGKREIVCACVCVLGDQHQCMGHSFAVTLNCFPRPTCLITWTCYRNIHSI